MYSSTEQDIMTDVRYVRKSCALVTEALKKGCDVLQMPNGDIVITEVRTVSFQYTWNDNKSKFEKVKSGSRLKKLRKLQKANQWATEHEPIVAETKQRTMAGADKRRAVPAKEEVLEEV